MVNNPAEHSGTPIPGIQWLQSGLDWLSRRKQFVLTAGLIFQLVVLITMIVKPATTIMSGDTLLLRVVPVDPRDLFRGDYVILNYEFSRIPPAGVAGLATTEQQGQTIYVALEPDTDSRYWRAAQFSVEPPTSGKFLRGQITTWGRVEFGIESFFVQEGTGPQYEQAARNGTLSAEVAVDDSGQAVLKRLVVE
jgi:uncharacterized membrane-anchored protein